MRALFRERQKSLKVRRLIPAFSLRGSDFPSLKLFKGVRDLGEKGGRISSCAWCRDLWMAEYRQVGQAIPQRRRNINTPPRIALMCSSVR